MRVYLGMAPGVGKTYTMLGEGARRAERGTDVVVAFVEDHGRPHTRAMVGDLEVVPRRRIEHRGATFEEMDVDAVLARRPQVALVDELAHTNVPGSRNAKRWQDVAELVEAGIDVITTVNIQHLESVNDVVERITGVPQRETVPDAVVRAADQVELVDMTAEALRRRLAHGNVYAPEKIDAALGNYFRPGNLNALREIALLWTADRVDDALQVYRSQHAIDRTWEARERVVVALTGGPEGDTLIRRAARIAARGRGELQAVHVGRSDGLRGASSTHLTRQQLLVESLGGSFHQVLGDDVPQALLAFARAAQATQLVLGDSRRGMARRRLTGPGIGAEVIARSGDIDVHIVTHEQSGRGVRRPPAPASLSRRRRLQGYAAAVLLPLAATGVLVLFRDELNLASDVLVLILTVVAAALVGGLGPGLLAAAVGILLLNYLLTPPLYTLVVTDANDAVALAVFLIVAAATSSVVDLAARRTREAARAATESRALVNLVNSWDAGQSTTGLSAMLTTVRESFGVAGAGLWRRSPGGPGWQPVSESRRSPDDRVELPGSAANEVAVGDLVLTLDGGVLDAADRRLAAAFAQQLAARVERSRLVEAAAQAAPLAEANRMRTALLAAVGHDLRTPLAAAKASVSSLRSDDVDLDPEDQAELLATADESLDVLARLVDNLLDMSRLQAGAMTLHLQSVAVEDVVALALDTLHRGGPGAPPHPAGPDGLPRVETHLSPDLEVRGDPGLLERVLANLLGNALQHGGASPVVVTASRLGPTVEIRVVDRGPGVAPAAREDLFVPFQRFGDTDNTTGIGLGLALSRGLTEAMGGTLTPEETPGGGLTMVVSLAAADAATPEAVRPGLRERSGS